MVELARILVIFGVMIGVAMLPSKIIYHDKDTISWIDTLLVLCFISFMIGIILFLIAESKGLI